MGIAEWILLAIPVIVFLDLIICLFYCLIAEKLDERKFRKRAASRNQEGSSPAEPKEASGPKKFVISIWLYLDSFLYGFMRYSILCVGKIPSHAIRKFLYRFVFRMKITRKSVIYGGCEIRSPWNIRMGNAVVAVGCILDGREKITIGDNVVFGSNVRLWTEEHSLNDPLFRVLEENSQEIVIEDRAWICSDSTLLPGVRVGEGAVVASRACVTKDCEPYTVYGGVPAKKISDRNRELIYELSGKPTWRFY